MKRVAIFAVMAVLLGCFVFGICAAADRFVKNNDGTVTDTQASLMWADKVLNSSRTWDEAKSYCEGYSGGGKSGWRMPTIDELRQLYNSGAFGTIIQNNAGYGQVWSANEASATAAFFNFQTGQRGFDYKTIGKYLALPVRSGK